MIDRDGDDFYITCDNCGEELHIDTAYGDWSEMIKDMKAQGWKSRKDQNDEWENLCPECLKAERKSDARKDFGLE